MARTVKYPGEADFEVEFTGDGRQVLIEQADYVLSRTGRPRTTSCEKSEFHAICTYTFNKPGRVLLTGISTRNGKLEMLQFIYLTREMYQARIGK